MDEFHRPDPDELLARVQAEEESRARGKLKIFLGYAAGVGKTYAMLEAAHQRREQNLDVAVGYIETHGRAETEALLQGLEVIPRKQVEYHGTDLSEMDVDAVLARKPAIALVDELAHTNAPGCRHLKRYQDVLELLDAGINVYTTLNIQHMESLNDVVQQITGILVRETVPDHVIDEADEIELIDLPPDELLQRLKEGKVYIPEQAVRALERFFRKGNLTALREMSMRRAAERVDVQMRDYMHTRDIPGPWAASERLMVCISSHPLSERLVRAGKRLADDLNAEWYAVYIETPERIKYSALHSERVARTMKLAEELGAKIVSISGRSVPEAVIDFAHRKNITKIIVGKPLRPRWYEMIRGSIVDEIIRRSGSIDIYIISDAGGPVKPDLLKTLRAPRRIGRYVASAALVGLTTLIGFPIHGIFHPANLVMFYLAAVVIAAVFLGRGPSMLASLLGVLAFDFFFVEPRLSFSVLDLQYLLTFTALLVVGLVISNLTGTVRDQVEASQRREHQISALYSLSRELTVFMEIDAVLKTIVDQISRTFSRQVAVFLPGSKGLELRQASVDFNMDDNEMAVAAWAFDHHQPAGRGTDTLPEASIRYQPLVTSRGVVGILGVKPDDEQHHMTLEQRQLLDAYAGLAAMAIERTQLADEARRLQVSAATEKLETALLNSISHDLRTPLASITGVFSSLYEAETAEDGAVQMDHAMRLDLIENGIEEAGRLNRIVGNLLDMTRLESGSMKVRKEPGDIQEVIGSALARMRDRLSERQVVTEIAPNLPLVPMDFVLIEQVLVNLLDNAVKYSDAGSEIEIRAACAADDLEVSVVDHGAGIPEEDLLRIFDKFYRVTRPDNVIGTGLGLSICKGIVGAHSGRIWAQNLADRVVKLTFTLPLRDGQGKE